MKPLDAIQKEKLLLQIRQLLLKEPSVQIVRSLEECLSSGVVPVSLLLSNGQRLKLIMLAHREPINFRLPAGHEHLLSIEQLAGMERPPHCLTLYQTLAWIKDVLHLELRHTLRHEPSLLRWITELEELKKENLLHSFHLTLSSSQLVCVAVAPLASIPHFTRVQAMLENGHCSEDNYVILSMVFSRSTGLPDPSRFEVVYHPLLEAQLDRQAGRLSHKVTFRNIRSYISSIREEVGLKIRQVEEKWEARANQLLTIYASCQNMVPEHCVGLDVESMSEICLMFQNTTSINQLKIVLPKSPSARQMICHSRLLKEKEEKRARSVQKKTLSWASVTSNAVAEFISSSK